MEYPELVTHRDVDVYFTMANTYRAYVKGHYGLDAWGSFRDSAIRKLIALLEEKNVPFDFSDAPASFWKVY